MKTAQEWFNSLGNRGEYAALPSIMVEEIEAIQADAFAAGKHRGRMAGLNWCRKKALELNDHHEWPITRLIDAEADRLKHKEKQI